jgi:deoxyribodipyrimidine photolyase-related protein
VTNLRVTTMPSARHLVLVLGDQLDLQSAAFDGIDPARDVVWMAEVAGESENVWSTQVRTTLFLSAMRHFRDRAVKAGYRVDYASLDDPKNSQTLAGELRRAVSRLRPERLVVVQPGEWRVQEALKEAAGALDLALEIREDRHFLCSPADFARHAQGRRQLRLEFFYREMRRRHDVLVSADGEPEGGEWNYDHENRESFGRTAPTPPAPRAFPPDRVTQEVITLVRARFPDRPGDLDRFDWPVTPEDAEAALEDFVAQRLVQFGRFQDAIWLGQPWLYHSRLAAAMNLKLLDPRRVIAAATATYRAGRAELAAVEGFIRQILGWREYVRGIYWHLMPDYLERNALGAKEALPAFFWTGEVPMACLRDAIGQSLSLGYAHHIQRLMVTGLYSLLLGVKPQAVHAWYLAVYVDAVEWVELPNTLGMSQYGDGGVMASKPYVATGRYIERMSNACGQCRFDPAEAIGPRACPFTTLYWDFLLRHRDQLQKNPRMSLQVRNVEKLTPERARLIRSQAEQIRANGGVPTAPGETALPLFS